MAITILVLPKGLTIALSSTPTASIYSSIPSRTPTPTTAPPSLKEIVPQQPVVSISPLSSHDKFWKVDFIF